MFIAELQKLAFMRAVRGRKFQNCRAMRAFPKLFNLFHCAFRTTYCCKTGLYYGALPPFYISSRDFILKSNAVTPKFVTVVIIGNVK